MLRHEVAVLRRQVKRPLCLRRSGLLAALSRLLPRGRWSCFPVTPETLVVSENSIGSLNRTSRTRSDRLPSGGCGVGTEHGAGSGVRVPRAGSPVLSRLGVSVRRGRRRSSCSPCATKSPSFGARSSVRSRAPADRALLAARSRLLPRGRSFLRPGQPRALLTWHRRWSRGAGLIRAVVRAVLVSTPRRRAARAVGEGEPSVGLTRGSKGELLSSGSAWRPARWLGSLKDRWSRSLAPRRMGPPGGRACVPRPGAWWRRIFSPLRP